MAARDKTRLIGEWTQYGGRIIYNDNDIVIIRGGDEWFVIYGDWWIHIIPGRAIALSNKNKLLVSHAPAWRGHAIRVAKTLLANAPIPSSVKQMIPLPLPL